MTVKLQESERQKMKDKYQREITQLWWVAELYSKMAEKTKNKLKKKELQTTVKEHADRCNNISDINGTDKWLMLLTAHLTSCAVRLCTIDDIMHSDRQRFYKQLVKDNELEDSSLRNNLDKIVHYLLRHNVAHPEDWSKRKMQYGKMQTTFMNLTIYELYDNMRVIRNAIIDEIPL
jgi:hypothetical protein